MNKKEEFLLLLNSYVKREGINSLIQWLESTDFFTAPASTRFHLSREGGLLEHSLNVYYRMHSLYVAEKQKRTKCFGHDLLTPEEEESIAITALLHDVCKANLYVMEPKNQKTYNPERLAHANPKYIKHDGNGDFIWETVMKYSFNETFPLGHGEKSMYLIMKHMRLTDTEAMAIRWHMGFSDDTFKGGNRVVSDALNSCSLAVLLYIADTMATMLDESEESDIHVIMPVQN